VNLLPKPLSFPFGHPHPVILSQTGQSLVDFPGGCFVRFERKNEENLSKHDFMFFLIESSRNPYFCTKKNGTDLTSKMPTKRHDLQ